MRPIQVDGPEFLFLFAALITIVAAFCWWRKWSRDSSAELKPLAAPERIDPYEVAYFRAGENELARVVIVGLIERKYLKIAALPSKWWKSQDRCIERASNHPATADLTPVELAAFEWFGSSRTAETIFMMLPWVFQPDTLKYEQKLRAERLLTSDELKDEARRNSLAGIAIVAAIGLARLLIGISRDKSVGYLLLMALVGCGVIYAIGRSGRLSRRGKSYLAATKEKWRSLKDSKYCNSWSPSQAASLFGFTVLADTEMNPLNEMFPRTNRSLSWVGNSGADSGGAACGGGCGGGCGGCGGCGG